MATKFKSTSNLRATPVTNGYADIYVPPHIPDFTQTTEFKLTQEYNKRPDLLAFRLYGDARFWWVFPLYNRNTIVDPINDFKTGLTILVPERNLVAGI